MTDNATPEPRNATGTPDGTTIDLLIDLYELIDAWVDWADGEDYFDADEAVAAHHRIHTHLMNLARRGALFQPEQTTPGVTIDECPSCGRAFKLNTLGYMSCPSGECF